MPRVRDGYHHRMAPVHRQGGAPRPEHDGKPVDGFLASGIRLPLNTFPARGRDVIQGYVVA